MTPQPTWRAERRADRIADAQIDREAATARLRDRITAGEARARLRRDEQQARTADRRLARKQRGARWAARASWAREHVTGLLFVPVIAVPSALAWTAMAAYGRQVFGPAGETLPAFSEGAMWAFAAAATITRRRHPDRPVWHLVTGIVVFAAVGAILNFLHGITPAPGATRGIVIGVVMALVSVAGVTAHQLITAGPRRSHAARAQARATRIARRREQDIARAALRHATAELDTAGNARLIHQPGTVTLRRRRGRLHLTRMPQPDAPAATAWPRPAPILQLAAAPLEDATKLPELARQEPAAATPASAPRDTPDGAPKRPARTRQGAAPNASQKRARAEQLLRDNPRMSRAELVEKSGVSERTADRIRSQQPTQLRVAR
jgi:hypothetical protein